MHSRVAGAIGTEMNVNRNIFQVHWLTWERAIRSMAIMTVPLFQIRRVIQLTYLSYRIRKIHIS